MLKELSTLPGQREVRSFGVSELHARGAILSGESHRLVGRARMIGEIEVMLMMGQPLEFELPEHSPAGPYVEFIYMLEGTCCYMGVDEWVSNPARLIVIPGRIIRRIRFGGEWKMLLVRIPRDAIVSLMPQAPSRIGTFEQLSTIERSMLAFAHVLVRGSEALSTLEAYAIEQLLLEMGGMSLLNRMGSGWARGAPQTVLLERARAVIAQQSADPSLTPAVVATQVSSSLRQLQSIFRDAGTSLAVEIRARRAQHARTLLCDARYDVLTIDQIAEQSGFGTTMSMRRALQDLYGSQPSEMRRERASGHVASIN